jgi:hypothetical protein
MGQSGPEKPQGGSFSWLSTSLAVLAAAGTALGAWGTYQSNQNKGRIDDLTAQIQATQQFAAGIHDARDVLTNDQHVKAMVELSRLYTLARTPQQKLVLIQLAQLSKQWQGLEAMATLIGNDDQLQTTTSAADRKIVASMGVIIASAQTQIAKEVAAPNPTPAGRQTPAPRGRTTPKPTAGPRTTSVAEAAAVAKSGDAPLTQSTNAAVAASAALIAALPRTVKQQGWIFLGDVPGSGSAAKAGGAPIIPASATTSARTVPAADTTIVACHDVNLRDVPLGKLIAIVSPGTSLKTIKPDGTIASAFTAMSVHTRSPITARWAFVEVESAVQPNGGTGCS